MASKLILFFPLLLVLALNLSTSPASKTKAGCRRPVINIINAVADNNSALISGSIKAGGKGGAVGSFQLSHRETYEIRADINDVYYTSVLSGLRFTSFHAYEPARDKGKAVIYWKANEEGFSISYDQKKWKLVAPWESE